MDRVLVLNGPNLNLLGTRRPDVYGTTTLADLDQRCRAWGAALGFAVDCHQSNHEGDLIERLHEARAAAGVVVNPGALTHYSFALHDAIEAIEVPTVEVHISDVKSREEWRRHSVVTPACVATIYGRGVEGYHWALRHLAARRDRPATSHSYGPEADHVADLRLPDGPGPHPVVVTLHGGFWRDPWQRDLMDPIGARLAAAGHAVWNPEYRRVGTGGGWPATHDDVAAAFDALADLPAADRLDLKRVVALGHSAGGQLALWAATAESRVRPGAVVALAPVADLAAAHDAGLGDGAVEAFLRRTPADGSGRYTAASPAARLPLGVPQRLVHGTDDDRVPVALSRAYVAAARAAGDDAALVELPGTGHFEALDPSSKAWAAAEAAITEVTALLP